MMGGGICAMRGRATRAASCDRFAARANALGQPDACGAGACFSALLVDSLWRAAFMVWVVPLWVCQICSGYGLEQICAYGCLAVGEK